VRPAVALILTSHPRLVNSEVMRFQSAHPEIGQWQEVPGQMGCVLV